MIVDGLIAFMKLGSPKSYWWIAAFLILIALLLLLLRSPPDEWTQASQWGEQLSDKGFIGVLFVFFVGVVITAVGLPRQLLAFVCGFAYGVLPGIALSLLCAIIGCAVAFATARTFLRQFVLSKYPKAVNWLDDFIRDDPFLKILVLRLQPLGTNLLTNLSAGVSGVGPSKFLISSLIGYVPQMLVFALMGSGVRVGSRAQLFVSLGLLGISIVLGLWLVRRHQLRRETC